MSEAEQLRFRIKIALRVCAMFRASLERNGNRYHGGLIPNLTSITDCLTIPFDILERQVAIAPELQVERSPFERSPAPSQKQ